MGKNKKKNYIEYTEKIFTSMTEKVYLKCKSDIPDLEKNDDGFGRLDIQLHGTDERNIEDNEKFFMNAIILFSRSLNMRVGCKYVPVNDIVEFWFERLDSKLGEKDNDYFLKNEDLHIWITEIVGKEIFRRKLFEKIK